MANVFTPEKAEHVLAISYETQMPNTTISYEVYLLDKDAKAPVIYEITDIAFTRDNSPELIKDMIVRYGAVSANYHDS